MPKQLSPLLSRIPSDEPLDRLYPPYNRTYRALERIAMATYSHGHGGILLVVPDGEQWRGKSIEEPIPYYPKTPFGLARENMGRAKEYFEQNRQEGQPLSLGSLSLSPYTHLIQQPLNDSLEFIGQLTAVDGATIITYDLDVLAFGAKIKSATANEGPVSVLLSEPFEDSEPKEIPISQLGGTRHQSAARFVYDQEGSIAFVASQDGRMTILVWDENSKKLIAIRPAELTFS